MQSAPNTTETLTADLRGLGVTPGMTLMVHASFRAVGRTEGGPAAAIAALFEVLGPTGTLVMPAASPQLVGTDDQRAPKQMFNIKNTPSQMGALAECFRTWPGTLRSDHPFGSVCAHGPNAADIVANHAHVFCEGPGTPYEKLYTLGAHTLLLGVGFNRCTSLHFAECRSDRRRVTVKKMPVLDNGVPRWRAVQEMGTDNSTHFPVVGEQFAATGALRSGRIGQASSLLFATRALVDFATPYFDRALDPV